MAKDKFGFRFWLGWILGFTGCFFVSAGLWTLFVFFAFGEIRGEELTLAWSVAVFGTWFLFLAPFMRKKERVWKRLNHDQEKAADLWLSGMAVYIGVLIVSSFVWCFVFRAHLYSSPGLYGPWIKSVLATWLAALIPFLVMMYRKADALFKEAHARQTQKTPKFRGVLVEKKDRLLSSEVEAQIAALPETLENGTLVTLRLRDNREIEHVFVINFREIVGLYAREEMDFKAADVVSAYAPEKMPEFDEALWLRLDGRI